MPRPLGSRTVCHFPDEAAEIRQQLADARMTLEEVADGLHADRPTIRRGIVDGHMTLKTLRQIQKYLAIESGSQPDDDLKILRQFSPEFLGHSVRLTHVSPCVPYDAQADWNPECDLWVVSHRELDSLWAKPVYFRIFEARQLQFIEKRRGQLRRIFLIGGERDAAYARHKTVVIARHHSLGFDTRVFPRVAWGSVVAKLQVCCHMFVVKCGGSVSFHQYGADDLPLIVETREMNCLNRASKVYADLWEKSQPAGEWLKSFRGFRAIFNKVKKDVKEIRTLAEGKIT